MVTGADGIFDVHVAGDRVFTTAMLGRYYPQPEDVMPLLHSRLHL